MEAAWKVLAFWLVLVSIVGCGPQGERASSSSSLQTVDLKQSAVRDQGRFGICWAYGTIGLVESQVLREQAQLVDLSEEALVFYHMAEGIEALFKTLTVPELLTVLSKQALPEGWNTRIAPEFETPLAPGEPRQHDALDLIKNYGLVPESAWSFKVKDYTDRQKLFDGITKNIYQLMHRSRPLSDYSLAEIISSVMVGGTAFPSAPPTHFSYANQEWSALDFAEKQLRFHPDDYGAFNALSEADYPKLVRLLKQALSQGHSVPLAFPINIDRIQGDRFTGKDRLDPKDWVSFARDGGHLVLISDYVNAGGREGALSTQEEQAELEKSVDSLDYIVFKNSWGLGAKTNEAGLPISASESGFYKMDQAYLRGAMRVPQLTANIYNNVQIVVPRTLLSL